LGLCSLVEMSREEGDVEWSLFEQVEKTGVDRERCEEVGRREVVVVGRWFQNLYNTLV
jgi:hypothetical protein